MDREELMSVVADIEGREEHPIDFEAFVEHCDSSYSTDTVANYITYLKTLDFDPQKDKPSSETYDPEDSNLLKEFDVYLERRAKELGKDFENASAEARWMYFIYLATSAYLYSLAEEKLEKLPKSRKFDKPESEAPVQAPEEKDVQKLVNEESEKCFSVMYQVLFYGGLRISEALQMKVSWIDGLQEKEESYISIKIPPFASKKNRMNAKPDFAFLPSKMNSVLREYIRSRYDGEDFEQIVKSVDKGILEDKYLFNLSGADKKTYSVLKKEKEKFNYHLETTAKSAGIEWYDDFSSHRFRKGYVHRMKQKFGLSKVADLARHESTDTTKNHYLKKELEDKGKSVEEAWS